MARHLSSTDVQAIINCIHGLEPFNLTWEHICDRVAPLIGKRPTRQSICKYPGIISAYKFCKGKNRSLDPSSPKPASLSIAAQRIKRLESEVGELKQLNRRLLEQFLTIQYNAYKHGLTEAQALDPLPRIDRERTDGQ